MAKQLKPGQLCTIYGKWWNPLKRTVENHTKHVYRCKKVKIMSNTFSACEECKRVNKNKDCLLSYNSVSPAELTCFKLFGRFNYPVLVK